MPMPDDHLIPEVSSRGFKHLKPLTDSYGAEVKVYESSSASAPHIWLSIAGGALTANGTSHLTVEQARQIADQLNWLADHHYQGGR